MRKERLSPRGGAGDTTVKMQKPIVPPNGSWLIYNQHHSIYHFMAEKDVPPKVRAATVKGQGKSYWTAHHDANGLLTLLSEAPAQEW